MTDRHLCPICAEPFKSNDICASDIELGICHAACLVGSPVVDLETGEETGGKADTYPYSEVMDPRQTPAPMIDDHNDCFEGENCWNCGGEGYVSDCFDGCCVDADEGCDLCTRRCDVCNRTEPRREAGK